MERARNDTIILLENSWIVSGTDTYLNGYNWQKRSGILTNFKNQMEQSKLLSCHLIYLQVSTDFFLLKARIPPVTELNTEANQWSIYIPRDCRRRSCVPSPLSRTQSGVKHRRYCQRLPPGKAPRGSRTQQHVSKHVEMPSSFCAQRLSIWLRSTQSSQTSQSCQRRLKQFSGDISLAVVG